MKLVWILIVLSLSILSGCASPASGPLIVAEQAWVRTPTGAGGNTAAYMILRNEGAIADSLVGASVEESFAENVEIHFSRVEEGIMKMNQVDELEIPANGRVELAPGGYHIMLLNVADVPEVGETIKLNLVFKESPGITVAAEVKGP